MLTTQRTTLDAATGGLTGTHDAAVRLCEAQEWLEAQRHAAPVGADVWDIRWQAQQSPTYLADLLYTLRSGQYRLSPLQLHGQGDERKAVWGAQDALVLKWVALSIEGQLPLHPACEHVKGHGGGRQSVSRLHGLLTGNPDTASNKTAGYAWVCRTDIRGYYRNISKETLAAQVNRYVTSPVHRDLISQYLHYTVEDGGTFHTPEKGISRGCPLSPLMGALHLYDMDEHFSKQRHIHYARYMDDIIILAATRWQLRKQTKRLMQWFSEYGFEAHPDKTQIGRAAKGFDWMGAWLTHEGVTDIAPRAKANHREKVRRLYERLARVPHWLRHRRQQQVHARVSTYRKRWNIWAGAILACGALTTFYTVASALKLTNYPSVIPGGGTPGLALGNGNITWGSTSASGNGTVTNTRMRGILGFYTNTTGDAGGARTVGGVSYILPLQGCPSIGLKPTGYSAWVDPDDGSGKGNYKSYNNLPPAGVNMLYATIVPPVNLQPKKGSGGAYWPNADAGSIVGVWTLLDSPTDPAYKCDGGGKAALLQLGFQNTQTGTLAGDGAILATSTPQNATADSGPWATISKGSSPASPPPAPAVAAACEFTNTLPLSANFGSQALTAKEIRDAKDSTVIAVGSTNFPLNITCTGNMTGVQPRIHVDWKNSIKFAKVDRRAGVRNELPADETSGVALMSVQGVKGGGVTCNGRPTTPSGLDYCADYVITPGTTLTLYPTLLRNTNTTTVVQSGVHTVTGTINLVMP